MEDNLYISAQGFNDENTARTVGNITLDIIRALEKKYQLDISKLKKIIISFDFQAALLDVASDFNHRLAPTFTDSKQATAIAKLFSKVKNDRELSEHTLVLCVDFFLELFTDDGKISLDNINQIIHRLHHELVHVHELNKNSLDNAKLIDDYDNIFLMTGKRAWSEYLANYMSAETATKESIDAMILTLEEVLNEVPNEIRDLVFKYQFRLIDLEEMHAKVTERIKLIANVYGYAYGYINALDVDIEAHFPRLAHLLSASNLDAPLKALGESFSYIHELFVDGGIKDFEVFNYTSKAINDIYASFDLRIVRNAEPNMGLYIHVLSQI